MSAKISSSSGLPTSNTVQRKPSTTVKINVNGRSCSSFFSLTYYIQSEDSIESLIKKVEQTVPCTKVNRVTYKEKELTQNRSIAHYGFIDDTIIDVQTNALQPSLQKTACMGCSYYNIIYLSANVARGTSNEANFNPETIKASINEWMRKLATDDQTTLKRWFNDVTKQAKLRFMVCTRDMLQDYVQKYRNTRYSNMIEFDYIQLLHELRCPVCFSKFSLSSDTSTISVRICATSNKHYICQQCFQKVTRCPTCNGELQKQVSKSEYVMNLLQASREKLEKYCFPEKLNDIDLRNNQRPFANGAFCNVYKVENYAIKCPRVPVPAGSDIEHAIIHEIFLSRPLSHIPNILTVYGGVRLPDFGVSIVSEYVNGPSLAKALNDGTILNMSYEERLDIALGICKGLGELHLSGIVHRDFKPENVLLQLMNSQDRVYVPKIADFGVSFLIQTASATAVQKSGGTVGYDSPEVANGEVPSFAADIYAASFTIYELLTGQRPFHGFKDTQIITKFTLQGQRPQDWNLRTNDPIAIKIPQFLRETIEKGWSATPQHRATIGEMIGAIRKAIDPNYRTCMAILSDHYFFGHENTYEFLEKFDGFELLAIQEIIKRIIIEDSEALRLLLDNYAWG